MGAHPDLEDEQAHLDRAHKALAAMRDRTTRIIAATDLAATEVDTEIARWTLERRLVSLGDRDVALCFGRLDQHDGEHFHIGRRHVEDEDGDPLVVDWRAPVSIPFYRATVQDPMDLHRRRRFTTDGPRLVDILDENFDDPDGALVSGGIPDPLLAELERTRTGEMRDIVATIAAEQDVVIRAPLETLLVVQGGPGTGKTAVALHRAAFLLYEHRDRLQDRRVLVVGPNPVFLRYISAVLPSLGETAVNQTTLEGFAGSRYRLRDEDDAPDVARLKGDPRLVDVLARAVRQKVRPPDDEVLLTTPWGWVRIAPAELLELAAEVLERDVPLAVAREGFRNQLLRRAYEHHYRRTATPALQARFTADLRAEKSFQSVMARMWPTVSAPTLLRSLYGGGPALRQAAEGILTPAEQKLLRRRSAGKVSDERWTRSDLPLLDELEFRINGGPPTYGHVVVDEAQDLSSMALRLVARRAAAGSMTVVGDLAQATTPWAQERWEDAVAHLQGAAPVRIEELGIGYRVPGPILDLANRLLADAAPHVRPARSVRETGDPPRLVAAPDAATSAADEAVALADRFGSVAVIAPADLVGPIEAALSERQVAWADGARVGLGERVTLLDPAGAKGLEFDAVVVAEPSAIVAGEPAGARALFVAMTRAVQHLSVVHADDLPAALRGE